MGPILFNNFSKAVKECSSPDSLKKTLDEFIMSLPDTPGLQLQVRSQPIIMVLWTGQ